MADGVSVVPGYEILEVLGRGGMGVVYKARQFGLNRLVALKMILSGSHAGESEVARFRAEAETVARLRHPHIVQIYEVGESEGRLYCALEYVDGGTLAQRLNGTPLPPREAAALLETMSRAVQAAHDANVIHRDLKPANVLLAARGSTPEADVPKIADFGLAKQLDDESGQTQTGQVMGTPSYMAPEQARGQSQAVTPAADLYALGAILYEMLTGRPPFKGATVLDTLEQVCLQEPVPPSRLQPTVSRDLDTICLKCLQKEPTRRYGSALALADDVQRFLNGEPIRARPVSMTERAWKWARRHPLLAVLTGSLATSVIALVILVINVLAANEGLRTQTSIAVEERLKAASRTKDAEDANHHAARQIVKLNVAAAEEYLKNDDLIRSFPPLLAALHELDKLPPEEKAEEEAMHRIRLGLVYRQIPRLTHLWPHNDSVNRVQFSADDSRVLTQFGVNRLVVRSVQTGEPFGKVMDFGTDVQMNEVLLSPDGKRVYTHVFGGAIAVLEVANAKTLWSASTPTPIRGLDPYPLACSPDGTTVFLGVDRALKAWDAETGKEKVWAVEEKSRILHILFSPDGTRFLTASEHAMTAWEFPSGKKLWSLEPGNLDKIFVSPGGRYLGATGIGHPRVWRFDNGQSVGPNLTATYGFRPTLLAFGPLENDLIVAGNDTAYGEVRRWRLPNMQPEVGTFSLPTTITDLHYGPDGSTVVIVAANGDVHLRTPDAFRLVVAPLRHSDTQAKVVLGRDGRYLLTCMERQVRLWDLAVGASRAVPLLSPSFPSRLNVSRDGNRCLVSAYETGKQYSFQCFDMNTGKPMGGRVLTNNSDPFLHSSPDARRFALIERPQLDRSIVHLWNLNKAEPFSVSLPYMTDIWSRVTFSGDGKRAAWSVDKDRTEIHDTDTGNTLSTTPHGEYALALNGDGSTLAIGGTEIHVVNSEDGRSLYDPFPFPSRALIVSFSQDGRYLLSGGGSFARLWDVAAGRAVTDPLEHDLPVSAVQLSHDGKRLAVLSGKDDGRRQVHLWDVANSRALTSPVVFPGMSFDQLQFSPDDRLLLVSQHGSVFCLLDAKTGERLSNVLWTPYRSTDSGSRIVFSADGKQVRAIPTSMRTIFSYDLSALAWDRGHLNAMATILAGQRPSSVGKPETTAPQQQHADWNKLQESFPNDWLPSIEEERAWRTSAIYSAKIHQRPALMLRHLDAQIASGLDTPEVRLGRVQSLREMKREDDALSEMKGLLNRYPDREDIWRGRADVYASLKLWEKAEADYTEALKRDATRYEAMQGRALTHVHRGQWREAANNYAQALKWRNIDEDLHRDHVLALLAAGDIMAARAATQEAWRVFVQDRFAMNTHWTRMKCVRLAVLVFSESPKPEEVVAAAREPWLAMQQQVESNLQYGAALFRAKHYDKALVHLEAVFKARQSEWTIRAGLFMAMVQHRLAKKDEAATTLNASIQLMDRYLKQPPESGLPELPWTWRVEVKALKREAEALLKEK